MKPIALIAAMTAILAFSSCDPVHDLKLENRSDSPVEVIFYPSLGNYPTIDQQVTPIEWRELTMNKLTLHPNELIPIGTVVAMYAPQVNDIQLEYLEVRQDEDTIRLIGKSAIFMSIQKVKKLDWRMIVK